jgi:hypothetical protein
MYSLLLNLFRRFGQSVLESLCSWSALAANLSHFLTTAGFDTGTFGIDVRIQSWFWFLIYRHFHLLNDALALVAGPFALATTPRIRAQNDFFRPSSFLVLGFGAGALSLLPVSLLYLARPLAVKPAPSLTDCFSPRPTDRETPFLDISPSSFPINNQGLLSGFLFFFWNREVNPFIKLSNDLLKR